MGKLLHTSKVKIQKEPGNSKIKRAQVEGFPDVLRMGIHGGIAQYFKLSPDEPRPATLDYIVAAVGGAMPLQSMSISWSTESGWPRFSSSAASSAWRRCDPNESTAPSESNAATGPRTENATSDDRRSVRPPVDLLISGPPDCADQCRPTSKESRHRG